MKNNEGKYWDRVVEKWTTTPCDCWHSEGSADGAASELHSHVVELVEEPAPVVVSEAEAEALARFKGSIIASKLIYDWACKNKGLYTYTQQITLIDHLMRAYVNGWVVEKPKLWSVKVPHVAHYIYRVDDGELNIEPDSVGSLSAQFTTAEIEHYGLTHCEKVEVSNKGERNE